MNTTVNLQINLRPFTTADAPRLAQLGNNKKIWDNVRDAFPHPYTLANAQAFIAHQITQIPTTVFAITCEGELCGATGLHPQEGNYRASAEVGYWIGEPYWGRGIATQAVALITAYGFDTLGMARIFAGAFATNAATMRVLEKNGYLKEGILRKAILKNGVFVDEHRFAKLKV